MKHEYNLETLNTLPTQKFDEIVLTVAHKAFLTMDLDVFKKDMSVVYDVKGIFGKVDIRGWSGPF